MGLLDSVIGAAVGGALGRGGHGGGLGGGLGGGAARGGRGGALSSPVVKALMLALAAKAAQEYMSRNRAGGGQPAATGASGGLGDLLGGVLGGGQGGLGGLLAGLGGAGGLGALVEQFNQRGQGEAMKSWVDLGPNSPIPPQQLAEALGPDNLAELEAETGLSQPQLLEELSRELPGAIDHITPNGRLPTADEILRATN